MVDYDDDDDDEGPYDPSAMILLSSSSDLWAIYPVRQPRCLVIFRLWSLLLSSDWSNLLSECSLASPGSPCTNLEAEDCKYEFIGDHCCCGQCSDSPWLILKCVLDSTTGSKLWQSTQPDSQTCPAEGCGSKGKKSNPPPHFPYNMQYCFAIFLDAKVKRKEKCIPQSVRRSVRSQRTVGDTFGFPICQCLWDLTKLLGKQVNNALNVH